MKNNFWTKKEYIWFCLQLTGYDYNLAELTVASNLGLWSYALTFLQCEFGDRVMTAFRTFDNELEQCDWYLFSIDTQQMLAIVILNAQQSTIICGFANTKFTRDSFKKVGSLKLFLPHFHFIRKIIEIFNLKKLQIWYNSVMFLFVSFRFFSFCFVLSIFI